MAISDYSYASTLPASADTERSILGAILLNVADASCSETFPRAIPLRKLALILSIARAVALVCVSKIFTRCPATAATWAMPVPMVPAPITPTGVPLGTGRELVLSV